MLRLTEKQQAFILLSLFYIGWMKFPIEGDNIYLADYCLRIVMLAFIWQERHVIIKKAVWPPFYMWLVFGLFLLAYLIVNDAIYQFDIAYYINDYLYETASYPAIEDPLLLVFDMSIGLVFVAITEEYLFRYKLDRVFKKAGCSTLLRCFLTSILFATIHAPQGLISLLETFLWGVFLFVLYQRSRSLQFVMVLHFIVNFSAFGLLALQKEW